MSVGCQACSRSVESDCAPVSGQSRSGASVVSESSLKQSAQPVVATAGAGLTTVSRDKKLRREYSCCMETHFMPLAALCWPANLCRIHSLMAVCKLGHHPCINHSNYL